MKAGHYLRWAEKSFDILTKFHGRMFDLGGEESDLWSDDLNCRHHDLERALEDDNYDGWGYDREGYFLQLQRKDESIQGCDDRVKYYMCWSINLYFQVVTLPKETSNRALHFGGRHLSQSRF